LTYNIKLTFQISFFFRDFAIISFNIQCVKQSKMKNRNFIRAQRELHKQAGMLCLNWLSAVDFIDNRYACAEKHSKYATILLKFRYVYVSDSSRLYNGIELTDHIVKNIKTAPIYRLAVFSRQPTLSRRVLKRWQSRLLYILSLYIVECQLYSLDMLITAKSLTIKNFDLIIVSSQYEHVPKLKRKIETRYKIESKIQNWENYLYFIKVISFVIFFCEK